MEYTSELSTEAADFLRVGQLLDAAGYSGEGEDFELIEFVYAASQLIPHPGGTDAHRHYIRSALTDEYRELIGKGLEEDVVPSYLLGSVAWRIAASEHSERTEEELKQLLDRSVRGIAQSRQEFNAGDERAFYAAFATHTIDFGQDYETSRRRTLLRLTRHIEQRVYEARRGTPMLALENEKSPRQSLWRHLVRGMAVIALKDAYSIQPPEDQRDEHGAWQLPPVEEEDEGGL